MILSTAWTTPAILMLCKQETRRDWSPKQILLARKQMDEQRRVDLWTKGARFKGESYGSALIVGLIEQEDACTIPDEAFALEGFELLTALGTPFMKGYEAPDVWRHWKQSPPGTNLQTVVKLGDIDVTSTTAVRLWMDLKERYGEGLEQRVTLSQLREKVKGIKEWEGV